MTGNGGNSGRQPAPPLYKLFWWSVVPLLTVMQAASLYAERRPLADLAQHRQFISGCHDALRHTLPRDIAFFSSPDFIQPKALLATTEGYRWNGRIMGDNDAGQVFNIEMTCEGPPQDPGFQLQMREVSTDDPSGGR